MKAKVLIDFKDKYTGEPYKEGDVIDIPQKRFKEMNKNKHGLTLVEEVKEPKKAAKTEK